MEHLDHEVALLKMRTEQWRIHLRSVPASSPEGRKVRSLLAAMKLKIKVLTRFARSTAASCGRATLH
jgi:hypothetical protein